jgi:branched-chain amino acid transport system substrate-binding protein
MQQDEEPRETQQEGLGKAVQEGLGKAVSRRQFLKYAGITGVAIGASGALGGLVAACEKKEETTTTAAGTGTTVATGPEPPAQDKIVIGAARPISGVNAVFEQAHFGPNYKLWVKDVNDAGGINVAGKKLPIELKVSDDQSDMDQSMRILTRLMEEDHVDFVFPPCSTAFLFAAAGVAAAHGYLLMSAEGGATTLETEMAKGKLPLFFQCLNYSNHYQMPAFAEIAAELGIKSASIGYIDDLHGIEYQSQAQIFFADKGIDILSNTPIPPDIKDMQTLIKQWQTEKADVLCSFQYPPANILLLTQLQQFNYNPKAFLGGPGCSTQSIFDIWAGAADGIMFEGAWTYKQNAEVQAYYDKLVDFVEGKGNVDFWGPLIYRAELEFFQQAVEEAATLNHEAIAAVMRNAHYKTVMSDDTFFTNQILDRASYAGQIGQWQNGVPHIIDVGDNRTAAPIYPKPAWGAPATSTT